MNDDNSDQIISDKPQIYEVDFYGFRKTVVKGYQKVSYNLVILHFIGSLAG